MPSTPGPGEIRRDLMELCSRGEVFAAFLRLSESGLDAAEHPGLWELVGRQAERAGDQGLVQRITRDLMAAGIAGPEAALDEARSAIDNGEPQRAVIWIESSFGTDPEDAKARLLLGTALVAADRTRALALLDKAERGSEADLVAAIDALRDVGELARARRLCEAALGRFPDHPMFTNRLGWIAEGMGDLGTARSVAAQALSGDTAGKVQALNRLVRLDRRAGDEAAATSHAAELLSLDAGPLQRLRLARTLGQTRLIETVVAGLPDDVAARRVRPDEAERVASFLLDEGLVGLVLHLWRAGVPIPPSERALLERHGYGPNGPKGLPRDFETARAIRSPDILFPLPARATDAAMPPDWLPGLRDSDRVLLVNSVLAAGGAERQFLMLVRSLVAAGFAPDRLHASLFSLEADRGHDHFSAELRETGIHIHDLSQSRPSRMDLPERDANFLALLPARLRSDVTALYDLARRIEPAVIHGWQDRASLAAGLVGQMLGTGRTVLSVRNMRPRKRGEDVDWIAGAVYSELLTKPGVQISANATEGARDYEDWLGLAEGQVGVLANAVDETVFRPRVHDAPRDRPVRVLGVFRMTGNKRPLLWLETVAALRNRHGIALQPRLVGAGPMAGEVRQTAERLGLGDLRLDPPVPDPSDIYRDSDVLLLMSKVEGTPNVVLEAQACGLAVAACRVGGVREAMHLGGASGGLLLDAEVTPDAAAASIAGWLPDALRAPKEPRVKFIHDSYSMAALAGTLLGLYGARR
jgi:glycosyltransferase involved in cell wall biosynthesis/Flp pilus assembly protein TadD